MNYKISVIVPAYNAERTIGKTIQSVLEQTHQNLEIIVVNDGSSDGTVDVVKSIQDERINIYNHSNSGVSASRNRGIDYSSGNFLAFIDSDDLWSDDKLERQLQALLQDKSAGVAYSWTVFMHDSGEETHFVQGAQVRYEGYVFPKLLESNFVGSGSNILVRRDAIRDIRFTVGLEAVEDYDFCLRLAKSWNYVVVPKNQIIYRKSPGSISSKIDRMEGQYLRLVEITYQSIVPENLMYLKKTSKSYMYRYIAELYLSGTRSKANLRLSLAKLLKAIWIKPDIVFEYYTRLMFLILLVKATIPNRLLDLLVNYRRNKSLQDLRVIQESQ
ncbi:glycosyltransferase family 2 protein [Nodosilinea sp. P-1105]|uniref:glycosyltransferase family 2 protein n=1 Tax=Nodosilinea sp. P-1105 TaxID=2546229 RepID=UPI001469C1CF|nr:glycosyltransferase family 2 protein [Nodosilinea sp. P-1105]NMF82947.1 glycosyltransferase family 2 protein [Nodosilinea sp. P-1105]